MKQAKTWEFTGYKEPRYWFGDRVYLLENLVYKGVPGTVCGIEWQNAELTPLPGYWYSVLFKGCVSLSKIHESFLTQTKE